jgi:uncharacterized protein (TIGR03000 family)
VVKVAPDARLFVDGDPVDIRAGSSFVTPNLDPDREYFYVFKAEAVRDGKTITETKRVAFRAGETARVSFTDLAAPPAAAARVTVRLPEDARLYVDDVLCALTSGQRSFETPKLEPGRAYYYTLKAEVVRNGRTESESKRIVVHAGKETAVTFGAAAPVQAAQR